MSWPLQPAGQLIRPSPGIQCVHVRSLRICRVFWLCRLTLSILNQVLSGHLASSNINALQLVWQRRDSPESSVGPLTGGVARLRRSQTEGRRGMQSSWSLSLFAQGSFLRGLHPPLPSDQLSLCTQLPCGLQVSCTQFLQPVQNDQGHWHPSPRGPLWETLTKEEPFPRRTAPSAQQRLNTCWRVDPVDPLAQRHTPQVVLHRQSQPGARLLPQSPACSCPSSAL